MPPCLGVASDGLLGATVGLGVGAMVGVTPGGLGVAVRAIEGVVGVASGGVVGVGIAPAAGPQAARSRANTPMVARMRLLFMKAPPLDMENNSDYQLPYLSLALSNEASPKRTPKHAAL